MLVYLFADRFYGKYRVDLHLMGFSRLAERMFNTELQELFILQLHDLESNRLMFRRINTYVKAKYNKNNNTRTKLVV